MKIRRATPADLEHLVGLEGESFGRGAWSSGQIAAELEGDRVVYVALDPQVVGWASFTTGAEISELLRIATMPTRRRAGVARSLFETGWAEVRALGAERVLLEVAESNGGARALYESLGFTPIHARRDYYGRGEHALVLELRVEAHG